jgi:hypothetical protein
MNVMNRTSITLFAVAALALPGRGWFPYMRMYGAEESAFNDEYKFPTVNKVKDFSEYIK